MLVRLDRLDPGVLGGADHLEGSSDRNFVGGIFQLAIGGPDLTGTLEPGDYVFSFSNYLMVREETDGQPMPSVGFGTGMASLS